MKNLVSRFVKDKSGATAIEYGLIAAGIALAIITVVNNLGSHAEHQVRLDLVQPQVSQTINGIAREPRHGRGSFLLRSGVSRRLLGLHGSPGDAEHRPEMPA